MAATSYLDRKLAGLCTRPGCNAVAPDDSCLCEEHRSANRSRVKRLYEKRKKAKLCVRCGNQKQAPRSVFCPGCGLKFGAGLRPRGRPPKNRPNQNPNHAQDRIAAATSVDRDGRSRYHGRAERGRQPIVELDRQDIAEMRRLLDIGALAIDAYWTPAYQDLPRLQRLEARAAAMSWLERTSRVIDEVLVRNGVRSAKPEDPEDG